MKNERRLPSNLLKYKSFSSYLIKHLSKLPFIIRFKEIYLFLRKYIFIGRIVKIIGNAVIIIQASAVFILYASIALFIIPALIIVFLLLYFFKLKQYNNINKMFLRKLKSKKIKITFIDDEEPFTSNDKISNDTLSVYVSEDPFFYLPKTIKKIDSNSYLISASYFYSFKKHIIDKNEHKIYYDQEEVL